jgi:hypothetical protein
MFVGFDGLLGAFWFRRGLGWCVFCGFSLFLSCKGSILSFDSSAHGSELV